LDNIVLQEFQFRTVGPRFGDIALGKIQTYYLLWLENGIYELRRPAGAAAQVDSQPKSARPARIKRQLQQPPRLRLVNLGKTAQSAARLLMVSKRVGHDGQYKHSVALGTSPQTMNLFFISLP
jgi:hypothetical protein